MALPLHNRPRRMATANARIELDLILRAQEGSALAQGQLFARHARELLPMLTRLLASTADAEDALQDTFIEAFAALSDLRQPEAFAGWLRKIAVHQAHRRFRRRRLLGMLGLDRHVPDATLAELAHDELAPDQRVELARIDAVLQRAPGRERAAWVLRHVEGHELTEVASLCDCSLATVKRWIAATQARIDRHIGATEAHDA